MTARSSHRRPTSLTDLHPPVSLGGGGGYGRQRSLGNQALLAMMQGADTAACTDADRAKWVHPELALDDPTPRRLVDETEDPGNAVAVYDLLGNLMGRFPADRGGYIFFMRDYSVLAMELGVDLEEVYHTHPRLKIEDMIERSACYLDRQGLARCREIARDAGTGRGFRERWFIVGYRGANKRLEVIDLSEEIDAEAGEYASSVRSADRIDAGYAFRASEAFENKAGNEDWVTIGNGHTHPTTSAGEVLNNNEPSIAGRSSPSDYIPITTADAKERRGEHPHAPTNAFIATQHGLTIHQSMGGSWTGMDADEIENLHAGDRYGIYDVYNYRGTHIAKSVSGAEEPAHLSRVAKRHGDVMTDQQALQRQCLMWELDAHQRDTGRL